MTTRAPREEFRRDPVRWAGPALIFEWLVTEGVEEADAFVAAGRFRSIHGGHGEAWDEGLVAIMPKVFRYAAEAQEDRLARQYDARFAGKKEHEWAAIEAIVPAPERAAKERAWARRLKSLSGGPISPSNEETKR